MNLTDSDLAELIDIIREDYGVELTMDEAKREGEALVHFAYLLTRPTP